MNVFTLSRKAASCPHLQIKHCVVGCDDIALHSLRKIDPWLLGWRLFIHRTCICRSVTSHIRIRPQAHKVVGVARDNDGITSSLHFSQFEYGLKNLNEIHINLHPHFQWSGSVIDHFWIHPFLEEQWYGGVNLAVQKERFRTVAPIHCFFIHRFAGQMPQNRRRPFERLQTRTE